MTQADQEEHLLAKSPEYRKNEMIMLEELRRRKQMKDFYTLDRARRKENEGLDYATPGYDRKNKVEDIHGVLETPEHKTQNDERWFEPKKDEIFDPRDFVLMFMDSDSVTNVTRLNRVNSRRVLIYIGNAKGLVSYGKGKSDDY